MSRLAIILAVLAAASIAAMWLVLHEMSDRDPLHPFEDDLDWTAQDHDALWQRIREVVA